MARIMPRVQEVVLPILRAALPGVTVGSWVADVDLRTYPILNVRRLGGLATDVKRLDRAVIELTAYDQVDLPTTENLYYDAREVLWDAVDNQTVVPGVGHLSAFKEVMGPMQFDSGYDDSWRIQGLIQLSIRPPRNP